MNDRKLVPVTAVSLLRGDVVKLASGGVNWRVCGRRERAVYFVSDRFARRSYVDEDVYSDVYFLTDGLVAAKGIKEGEYVWTRCGDEVFYVHKKGDESCCMIGDKGSVLLLRKGDFRFEVPTFVLAGFEEVPF